MHFESAEGARWELALDLIESGGEGITVENVLIHRYVGFPDADEMVHISIFTAWDPAFLTLMTAAEEVQRGLTLLRHLRQEDPRFDSALERHGFVLDYRYDYGMGATTLAEVEADGELLWQAGHRPRS